MIAAFLTFSVAMSLAQPARPPAFNPAQDAPHTVGQPGHLAPEPLPRSPHKRALPPEKGPGIWAGDEAGPEVLARLTGMPIYASGQPLVDVVLRSCSAGLEAAADDARLAGPLAALGTDVHLCVVASMMLQCASMLHEMERAKRLADEVLLAHHAAAIRYLTPVVNIACRDDRLRLARGLLSRWSAAFGSSPGAAKGRQ